MPDPTPRKSLITTGGPGRSPNRAMLRGVGFTDEDFGKPTIGVASLFSDITPCNAHLDRLALKGREGIESVAECHRHSEPQRFPTAFRWVIPACGIRS